MAGFSQGAGKLQVVEKTIVAKSAGKGPGSEPEAKSEVDQGSASDSAQGAEAGVKFETRRAQETQSKAPKHPLAEKLGEIVWLMTQSSSHKHFALADLDWMVMPPLVHKQYRVFRGENGPVGAVFWAWFSEAAEEKFQSGAGHLRPDEWKSGDRLWLINLIAPFATAENRMLETMISELMRSVLEGKRPKMLRMNPKTGKRETVEVARQEEA